jgi:hypothetical protein
MSPMRLCTCSGLGLITQGTDLYLSNIFTYIYMRTHANLKRKIR